MSNKLRKPDKIRKIKLGDSEYELPRCTVNILEELEDELECSSAEIADLLQKRMARTLKRILFVLLRKKYPDMTAEIIGNLVDMRNLTDVATELGSVLAGE